MVIAEIGANHHQDFEIAKELVRQADAISDAVKVQMFTPEQMADQNESHIKDGQWAGMTLYELYEDACMPVEWVPVLKTMCKLLIASVYHPDMVDIAEEMGIEIYKIASFEITYLDLIKRVAKTKRPIIISTGMAEFGEIKNAVDTVRNYHNDITLLKCTSKYPADLEDLNLQTIGALRNRFKVKVGFSDHTTGFIAPMVAASLGASVIEKHITLDKKGLDGKFSIYPNQFKIMYWLIKEVEKSLGEITYGGEKNFRRTEKNGKWIRSLK